MGTIEIFVLAIGLAMDAFAASICKGLSVVKINIKSMCIVGLWFGLFQGLMPLVGYFLGKSFENYITLIDHWIAFFLLLLIGINMIIESFSKEDDKKEKKPLNTKSMFIMAVATSIDALAVGVTFAFFKVNITFAVVVIGVITFVLSAFGIKIGNAFGTKYKSKAEILGGSVLIVLGTKILFEHLGILSF